MGIKGASALCAHKSFDLSQGCVIDYMHCVCLGVVSKTLMSSWLKPANHSASFSIRRKVAHPKKYFCLFYLFWQLKQCDDRLEKICVPHDFSRAAQSLSRIKQWKGIIIHNNKLGTAIKSHIILFIASFEWNSSRSLLYSL